MTDVGEKRWYAIQVKPRCEKRVSTYLHARGVEEFLPLYSRRRQWSDRSKLVELPLFPRYMFGRLDRTDQGLVKQAPGVRSIVGSAAGSVPMDDGEIETIRGMVDSGLALKPRACLVEGQRVRVEHGPLVGCEGVFERFKGARRLVVNVSLLHRSVAVEIDPSWVTVMPESVGKARQVVPRRWSSPRLRRGPV